MAGGCILTAATVLAATPVRAQIADEEFDADEIVVTAERLRSTINVPQEPVAVLDEEEIASFGAGSLAELVEQLAPQSGSGRGRGGGHPLILVNGQRISGFRELRNYPPEAIRKIEVLPEEVALRYGYPANQRVLNFLLKDNFAATSFEVELGLPGAGGYATNEVEASWLRIDGPRRLNIAVESSDSSALTEAERGLSSSAPVLAGDPAPAAYRSLIADSRDLALNTNWSTGLGENGLNGSLSLNAAVTRSDSLRLSGLDTVTLTDGVNASALRALYGPGYGARVRDARTDGFELGATLNRPLGAWDLTATASWAHEETRSKATASADTSALRAAALAGTIAVDAPVADLLASGLVVAGENEIARSNTEDASTLLTLSGRPFDLPAGAVAVTVKAGYDWSDIDSTDTRNPGIRTNLRRGDANTGVTVGIPISSKRDGVLAAIGDLSLDLSAGARHLSDFGTLYDWSAGLTWEVLPRVQFTASRIYREAAPTLSQLGAPQVLTSGTTVYDFATGQTVVVDVLSGGNPDLVAERQADWKLGVNYDLPFFRRSRLIAEYYDETSRNVSASFPVLTPRIEAAFPDRVIRDGAGNIVSIDQRPVTFARQEGRRIRYGIDVSDRISGGEEAQGSRGGRSRSGGPGFGGDRKGGRWSLALYHTWRLEQKVTLADGGAVLDLLDGDALSSSPTARHELELETGVFYNGFGARLTGSYLGSSTVEGTGAPGSSSLTFHPISTFNLRLFADLGRQEKLVDRFAFLKGSRVSLSIDNLFDAQQRVTDDTGMVPVRYDPDFLDPAGRFFEIEFRKQF